MKHRDYIVLKKIIEEVKMARNLIGPLFMRKETEPMWVLSRKPAGRLARSVRRGAVALDD